MRKTKLVLGLLAMAIVAFGCSAKRSDAEAETEVKKLIVYYSLTGNTEFVAQQIQTHTGADVFRLQTVEPYSEIFEEVLERANREREANTLPQLAEKIDNIADYDIIFIGSPNWFGTLALPVLSFLEDYDLSGKTVVPFITYGRGGLMNTVADLKAALPNSKILEEFGVFRDDVQGSQEAILQWLEKIEMSQ